MHNQDQQVSVRYKDLVHDIFENVLIGSEYNEFAINQYFDKDYIQYVDGKSLGFEGPEGFEKFKKHLQKVKTIRTITSIQINTLVQEGDIVFSNHVVASTNKEGTDLSHRKVIAEFRFNSQGKVNLCDEVTALITNT